MKKHLRNVVYVNFIIFLDKNFSYGPFLCNGCYDMSLKAVNMQNLTIIDHNVNHYRVNFAFISKKDSYTLIKNATIIDKKEHYYVVLNQNKITFVCAYYKNGFKKKTKFGDKEVNKKDFYSLKQAIPLDSLDLDKIAVLIKLKINETTWKYLCGYFTSNEWIH